MDPRLTGALLADVSPGFDPVHDAGDRGGEEEHRRQHAGQQVGADVRRGRGGGAVLVPSVTLAGTLVRVALLSPSARGYGVM